MVQRSRVLYVELDLTFTYLYCTALYMNVLFDMDILIDEILSLLLLLLLLLLLCHVV